ncbi:methyl-accepting chemotaxis protein [Paenibacillus sp. FSL H8-0537]|uniref:methyl-accepting chemotaxis protein n=1 Tax=Paenibacillus sp. FSL H8-0537 TaxID=2921399 RepID=UPI003100FA1A
MLKLSLRWRLALLAAIPLIAYVVSSFYYLNGQQQIVHTMTKEIYNTSYQVNSLILNADRDMYQAYQAYLKVESGTLNAAEAEEARKELSENIAQVFERVGKANAIIVEQSLQKLAYGESGRTIEEILGQFQPKFELWSSAAVQAAAVDQHQFRNAEIDDAFKSSRSGLDEIGESIDKYSELTIATTNKQVDQNELVAILATTIFSLLLVVVVIITVRQIMRTVRIIVAKSNQVAAGDLTVQRDESPGGDELGRISAAVDHMIDTMRKLIAGISESSVEVSAASSQLTAASQESTEAAEHTAIRTQEVAQSSMVQARIAQETSRAIEEMAVGIQRIAENTTSIAMHSSETSEQTEQSQQALAALIAQMEDVRSVITKLSESIQSLEHRSQQIGKIAQNITAFAGQTNILSLNASIEAARAGEQGKGFAVVAEEIRKLAAASLESAEGINTLVAGTRSEIGSASSYMATTVQEVENGGDQLKVVQERLDAISIAIEQIANQLHDNSAIAEQLSAGSQQISASTESAAAGAASNLEKTDDVAAATEEQLAQMEHIAASAQALNRIVSDLETAISSFKVN